MIHKQAAETVLELFPCYEWNYGSKTKFFSFDQSQNGRRNLRYVRLCKFAIAVFVELCKNFAELLHLFTWASWTVMAHVLIKACTYQKNNRYKGKAVLVIIQHSTELSVLLTTNFINALHNCNREAFELAYYFIINSSVFIDWLHILVTEELLQVQTVCLGNIALQFVWVHHSMVFFRVRRLDPLQNVDCFGLVSCVVKFSQMSHHIPNLVQYALLIQVINLLLYFCQTVWELRDVSGVVIKFLLSKSAKSGAILVQFRNHFFLTTLNSTQNLFQIHLVVCFNCDFFLERLLYLVLWSKLKYISRTNRLNLIRLG